VNFDIRKILATSNILKRVDAEILSLTPLCDLIDASQRRQSNLAEAVEDWIKIKVPQNLKERKLLRDKLVFSEAAILSNILHHKYKASSMTFEQKALACEILRRKLQTSNEYEMFIQYLNGENMFDEILLNDLTPFEFWETFAYQAPNLSALGLLYTSLPASTAQLERSFSQWAHVHSKSRNRLAPERSKKLFFIYHALSLQKLKS
jgi:hypothetical protein